MHSDHPETHHRRNKHQAEFMEGLFGKIMVAAAVILAAVLIYGVMTTGGSSVPSWMH